MAFVVIADTAFSARNMEFLDVNWQDVVEEMILYNKFILILCRI